MFHVVHEIRLDAETRRVLSDFLDRIARIAGERGGQPVPIADVPRADAAATDAMTPAAASNHSALADPRPAGEEPASLDVSSTPANGAGALSAPATLPAGAAFSRPPRVLWSPERDAILRREYPAGTKNPIILAAVNALPGVELHLSQLYSRVSWLNLKRPAGRDRMAAARAARKVGAGNDRPRAPIPPPVAAVRPTGEAAPPRSVLRQGPIVADKAQIMRWANQRGLCADGKLDLVVVNRKARDLGLPEFELAQIGGRAA